MNLELKTTDENSVTTLDALGQLCPWPLVLTKQALKAVSGGNELCVLADDPFAELDIRALCERDGHAFLSLEQSADNVAFTMRIRKKY